VCGCALCVCVHVCVQPRMNMRSCLDYDVCDNTSDSSAKAVVKQTSVEETATNHGYVGH
jgi:hypothetical protein